MSNKAPKSPDLLKRRSDFLRLQQKGRKWVAPTVIVQADAGAAGAVRYGLTATKKLGNAVLRNRIKRRLREAVRKTLGAGGALPFDIVLIGRVPAADCPFETLVKDLRWCLKRLEVIDVKNPA
jgi:ribonuclease P protein component